MHNVCRVGRGVHVQYDAMEMRSHNVTCSDDGPRFVSETQVTRDKKICFEATETDGEGGFED